MEKELIDIRLGDNWKAATTNTPHTPFPSFVQSYQTFDEGKQITQEAKGNHFLRIAHTILIKHFRKWINGNLLSLGIAGEAATAQVICLFLYGESLPSGSPSSFVSEFHGGITIDLHEFTCFLHRHCDSKESVMYSPLLRVEHQLAINIIKEQGRDMWEDTGRVLTKFKNYYLLNISPLATNTHGVEAACKESNLCNLHGRSKKNQVKLCHCKGWDHVGDQFEC